MLDLAHGAAITRTQLADNDQIFSLQVQTELYTNLERVCAVVVVSVAAGSLGVAGGGGRLRRRSTESETLDVLPLHRLRLEGGVGHGCGWGVVAVGGGRGCSRGARRAGSTGFAGRRSDGTVGCRRRRALGQLFYSVSNLAPECDGDVTPITIRKWAKGGPQRLLD